MQAILIYIFVAAAAFYIGQRIFNALRHKEHEGCEHCSAADSKKIASK
jgi:hypothetical protein